MMPYPDAMLLWRTLEDAPPVRILFAAFAGYENKNKRQTGKPVDGESFLMMQKIMGGAEPMPAHLKDALLWAEGMKQKHPGLSNG